MKYFSYGMNTNLGSMSMRCPKAQSLGSAVLPHYGFEFKTFATVVPSMDNQAHGVLWEITEECERSLDRLEGYPLYYGKINVWVKHEGLMVPAMTYLMYPEEEFEYPSKNYVDMLEEGYTSHGISLDQINYALMRLDEVYDSRLTKDSTHAKIYSYNY